MHEDAYEALPPLRSADGVYRVAFVCTGNICRSPMAEVVLNDRLAGSALHDRVLAESYGTGDWHVGDGADPRTVAALRRGGHDGTAHRARQVDAATAARADLLVALDRGHRRLLEALVPEDRDRIVLLRAFEPGATHPDVPDPYFGADEGFDEVLAIVTSAVDGLVAALERELAAHG